MTSSVTSSVTSSQKVSHADNYISDVISGFISDALRAWSRSRLGVPAAPHWGSAAVQNVSLFAPKVSHSMTWQLMERQLGNLLAVLLPTDLTNTGCSGMGEIPRN